MIRKMTWFGIFMVLILLLSSFTVLLPGKARADDEGQQIDQYTTRIVDKNNQVVYRVDTPGNPPPATYIERAMALPEPDPAAGTNTLTAPAYNWVYGCGATSAGMMAGYYDQPAQGYTNIYAGSTNGGVAPLNNETYWTSQGYPNTCGSACTCGKAPFIASMNGLDGRTTKGHVDDYWLAYACTGDPYSGVWPAHTDDCLADYMGTNIWTSRGGNAWNHSDGNTIVYYGNNNTALYDYTGCEPGNRDFNHGMRLFYESRGYTVTSNYSQYIYNFNSIAAGFTFAQYKAEIDAGRPVILHLTGHYVLGVGYNDSPANTVYLHNTWGHTADSMTWGGTYAPAGSGYSGTHFGVITLHLASTCKSAPGTPSLVSPAQGASMPGNWGTFTWAAGSGESPTAYVLEVNSSNTWGTATRIYYANVGSVTSKAVSPLPNNGSTLYWRVIATNACGWSAWSASRSFTNTVYCYLPGTPSLVSPAQGASVPGTSGTFTWAAGSGASPTKYVLEINSSNTWGTATRIYYADVGNVTSKTVTVLPNNGSTLYWRVIATNACGWSAWSASRSFTNTATCLKPGTPSLVSPAQGASVPGTSGTFTWAAGSGGSPTAYVLEVNSSNAWGTATRIYYANVGNVTSKAVTVLPNNGSTLYWRVIATNACGWGPWSASRSFTNTAAPPPAPLWPRPTIPGTSITFNWNAVTGADSYYLQISTSSTFAGTSFFGASSVGNVTSRTVTGFPNNGTVYYWRVQAHNAAGLGPWSGTYAFINGIANPPPTGITITQPTLVNLTWDQGSNQTITWTYTGGNNATVKIELYKGGVLNSTLATAAAIGSGGSGSWTWAIPAGQTIGTDYKIKLTTSNSLTSTSANNFTIQGQQRIRVELTWEGNTTTLLRDVDTHFIRPGGTMNSATGDCYYSYKNPDWSSYGYGHPHLNRDSGTSSDPGNGPEILTTNDPGTGTYNYKVYYYTDNGHGATTATAKIWINGVLRDTRSQSITNHQTWNVWNIAWTTATQTATVTYVGGVTEPAPGSAPPEAKPDMGPVTQPGPGDAPLDALPDIETVPEPARDSVPQEGKQE